MDININEEVKDSLFDLIQNAYRINIDFLKMKNGDLPNIKELLKKTTTWPCSCGQEDNDINKIICTKCSRYRGLETYNNILFNPLIANKKEINDLIIRRKHEQKVFLSLLQRNVEAKKTEKNLKDISFYVIDTTWFNKWKAFVTNDLTEKLLPNDLKYISDNKKIGVLPPDIIDNSKICTINNIKSSNYSDGEVCKYKLKKGLKPKKDFMIINQYLWEWLLVNYSGGPEIKVTEKMYRPSSLAPINENNEIHHKEIFIDENNLNKNIINNNNIIFHNNINKNFNKNKNTNIINNNSLNNNLSNIRDNKYIYKNRNSKLDRNKDNTKNIYNNDSSNLESSELEKIKEIVQQFSVESPFDKITKTYNNNCDIIDSFQGAVLNLEISD